MSASLVLNSGLTSFADNTTRYVSIIGGLSTGNPTEAQAEHGIYEAGTFSKLYTSVLANTITGNVVATLRKSGVNTALTVTYGTGQTGSKEDTTNTATYAATDTASLQVVAPSDPSGVQTIDLNITGLVFTPTDTSKTITFLGSARNATNITNASTSRYMAVAGPPSAVSSTTSAQWRVPGTFTARNLRTHVSANARTTDTVFSSHKNGSAGALTLTYTSGQTGTKEDTTHTDSLVADDEFQFVVVTNAGTETLTLRAIGCDLASPADQFAMFAQDAGGEGLSASTVYISPGGDLVDVFADTESKTQQPARMALTVSRLTASVASNTLDSATDITFRTGNADTALTISYAATETGVKADTTHSASVSTTDVIATKIVAAGAGTITFRYFSALATLAGGTSSTPSAGALTFAGLAGFLGFTINMPDEL